MSKNKLFSLLVVFTLSFSSSINAQVVKESKVFLTYVDVEGRENVNGPDALQMLGSYIKGKTNLEMVDSAEEAEFTFELSVYKKGGMGNRRANVDVIHNASKEVIYSTGTVKGRSSAFNGYSGSRAAIGKTVKSKLLKEYKEIRI